MQGISCLVSCYHLGYLQWEVGCAYHDCRPADDFPLFYDGGAGPDGILVAAAQDLAVEEAAAAALRRH